jgi:hypothetical protein
MKRRGNKEGREFNSLQEIGLGKDTLTGEFGNVRHSVEILSRVVGNHH